MAGSQRPARIGKGPTPRRCQAPLRGAFQGGVPPFGRALCYAPFWGGWEGEHTGKGDADVVVDLEDFAHSAVILELGRGALLDAEDHDVLAPDGDLRTRGWRPGAVERRSRSARARPLWEGVGSGRAPLPLQMLQRRALKFSAPTALWIAAEARHAVAASSAAARGGGGRVGGGAAPAIARGGARP